jgi:hypothetical protein
MAARTPAEFSANQPLNFAERNDIAIFNKGCEPLEGDKYDGTKLNLFLARLQVKAEKYNWNSQGLLTFGPRNLNLLTQYGEITMEQVKQAAEAYQPLVDRRAQNSAMLFSCVMDSITTEVFAKVNTNPTRYRITVPAVAAEQGRPAQPEYTVNDGVCFLKAIIDDTYANTATNTALARRNLANLRDYIKTIPDQNITTFHQYVKENLQELEAANETTTDLLVNLFAAYREVKDLRFTGYVQPIQDRHYDGREPQNANGLTLMTTVENYYKGMVKDGIWMKRVDEQETIIALKAQLAMGRNRDRRNTRQNKDNKDKNKTKEAWKTIPPKEGESGKKVVEIKGKKFTYYWCSHHRKYTMHKPQECRLKDEKKKGEQEKIKGVSDDPRNDTNRREKTADLRLKVMNAKRTL